MIEDEVLLETELTDDVLSNTGGNGKTISEVSPWKSFSVISPSGLDSSSVEGVHFGGSEEVICSLVEICVEEP